MLGFLLNTKKKKHTHSKNNRRLTGIIKDATKENGKWWLFGHWPHLKISNV